MSYIPYSEINSISLYPLGNLDNEIESHVRIIYQDSMRGSLPYPQGIYDDHMGSTSHEWNCGTCHYDKKLCPGHFGSITLNYPILSPMFIKEIIKWLKIICFNCGDLLISYKPLPIRKDKILGEYVKLTTRASNKNVVCANCQAIHPHITKDNSDPVSILMEIYENKGNENKSQLVESHPLYPHQIKKIFERISDRVIEQMGKPLFCHPKKFILNTIKAPPNPIRPDIKKIGAGRSNNNDLTVLMSAIVKFNEDISSTVPNTIDDDLKIKIHNLNLAVYEMVKGSSGTSKRSIVNNSKKPLTSIAKRWGKKQGRIRKSLMGKRVLNMARSFITCDVFLKIDELGVPISIAKSLQFPEIVCSFNYEQLLIYFMNGIKRYPGSTKIKKGSNGKIYYVEKVDKLEIGDTIYRDLIEGDIVAFNRQPSLESSSISSMKVKIMDIGETFRINLSACVLFNADFDGDAMNLLLTRTRRTTNEIAYLGSLEQFFISYKDGSPKIGGSHDNVIGIAELTRSDTRLNKFHAMRMFTQVDVYHDFSKYPSDKVFTGREIITILLKDTNNLINYTGRPSMYKENQTPFRKYDPADIKIEIDRGELKSGILDKSSIGEGANGGVFHIIHNRYGAAKALEAVFNSQQIALNFLYSRGCTISMKDLLLKDSALKEIYQVEKTLIADSLQITEQLNQGKIIPPIGKTIIDYYEGLQINVLNPGDDFWQYILPAIDAEDNNLFKLIMTGSRGKLFNFKNISSSVGQIELNGERMKENFGGRSLAYFTRYDAKPSARGYIGNSYISGMNVTEFIFHTMDTRYSMINKYLSISITGMHNRMSIKNLESLIVDNQYKSNSDGKITQLIYGSDGADPRSIEEVKIPTMKKDLSNAQFELDFHSKINLFDKEFHNKNVQELLDSEFEQLKKDRDFFRNLFIGLEIIASKPYKDSISVPINVNRIIEDTLYDLEFKKFKNLVNLNPIKTIEKVKHITEIIAYCLINEIQEKRKSKVPEHIKNNITLLQILIRSYLNTSYLIKKGINNDALDIIIINIKNIYSKSLISYGKAVGIIAAQSISEPMSQLVLDAHHNSGSASVKKKGMFRVKEIFGARPTDKMKSSSMLIQVLPEYQKNKSKVREIANHIEMLSLRKFIEGWQIFFEKYGNIVHPSFKHENEMIKEFEKYNIHLKIPSDLANWCIRLTLNKSILIEKQMKVETIYYKIRQEFPATYIIYNSDNSDVIVMRIYVRNIISKRSQITTNQMIELTNNILDTVIRGIKGIIAAYVQEIVRTEIKEDGSLASEPVYSIFTDGTNLEAVLENSYIDPHTTHSDSIIETYNVCGIIAARQKIIYEIKHQIEGPSHRQYTIYGDIMTFPGYVTSIDRYGSEKRNSSILLRISDASPVSVIENAAVNGFSDDLSGISPPIILGKNPQVGDLYNTFKLDEAFVKTQVKDLKSILDVL